MRLETQLIHAGEARPRFAGAVGMPVFQNATFEGGGGGGYHDVRYIRLNNTPNHVVLHAKLAALEGGEAALVASSGMAAISTAILSLVSAGDHILAQDSLYGGTHDLITKDLPALGIRHTRIDASDPSSWAAKLEPRTRLIYVEALTNPLLTVGDLAAVPRFAREHGLRSLIDSTFATPVNFRPLELGYDLVLHSASKYLNGHTDLVAGAAIGSAEIVKGVKHKLDHLGGTLDPHACFLLHRGLKTLALRVRHQNASALEVARALARHPAVARVYHPGLPEHPGHARARELMTGFGGVLSFDLRGGREAAQALLDRVALPAPAPSLGGTESLITRPAATSHAGLSPEERALGGIGDGLVRLSVGLEAPEDLIEDLVRALG